MITTGVDVYTDNAMPVDLVVVKGDEGWTSLIFADNITGLACGNKLGMILGILTFGWMTIMTYSMIMMQNGLPAFAGLFAVLIGSIPLTISLLIMGLSLVGLMWLRVIVMSW